MVRRSDFGAFVATMGVYVLFAVVAGANGFLTLGGTAGWIDSAADLAIVAIPVAILMIAGEFDLSVGAMVGASGMVVATGTSVFGLPIPISIVLALAFGAAIGLLNAVVRIRTQLPSFIVTLATLLAVGGAALGLARLLTGSTLISLRSEGLARTVFGGSVGPFSVTVLWAAAIAVMSAWLLGKTPFGNWVYATGGNPQAAREAGVPTDRVKVTLYLATALAASLVGILEAIQFNGGDATRGQDFVFNCVVAAVIGGVLLTGGYGSVYGALLGTATYGVISIGLYYTGWSTDWETLFLGSLVLLAVVLNNYFRRLALSTR